LPLLTQAQIAFVQRNFSVPQTPQATVTAAYAAAQTAGNLNVVIVGWNDSTATVTSISDTKGNPYSLAVGPTVRAGQASQSIYFAPNIAAAAAGANTVTVRFSAAAVFPDVRVLEYRGLDPVSPLHASAASSGSSNSSSSGTLAVSVTSALLVAGNTVATTTGSAGTGFTNRVITSPNGDIAEDRIVSAAGSYSATANLDSSGYWVMQVAAFRAGTGAPNTAPTISNVPAQVTNEDTPTSTIGFTVGDAETAAANLTVSGTSSAQVLVPNANIAFGGSGANRTVTITPAANQFGVTTITLTVSDGSLSTSASFQLTVNAVNDAPTISAIGNQATTSGMGAGPIGFTVGDVDTPVANLTLSGASSNTTLVPNAGITFGGSGASRTVTVAPAAGQTGVATITVTVSDGVLSTSTGFQLTVNATNTPPTISTLANQSTIGGTATTAIPFTIGDAETPAASLTLSGTSSNTTLVPNANIVFGGNGVNRTVTLTPAANQFGTSIITVTVSDGLLATSAVFQLTVNDSAPTISAIANQTTTSGTATAPVAFTVADLDTPLASLTLSSSSSNLTLVPNSGIAFGGSGANRTITVTPAAGQSGTATITATVSDGTLTASSSFVLTVNPGGGGGTPAVITFRQVASSVPQTPQSTVSATYAAAQTAGNLNVVIVGWNDTTATVTSVTDTKGNAYSLAIGPTVFSGHAQSIYYAPNIAGALANGNAVTVRFSVAANFPDVRVLEYAGIDPVSPLHAVTAATGNSNASNSGALTVSVPNVLLAAGNTVATTTGTAGAGFTRRVITSPNGDIAEDRVASATGSYTATANLDSSGAWVMQMAAFRGAVTGPNTPPTISNVPAQVDTEDTPSGTIAFTVGDAETPAASLTLSGSSSNLTLVPNANIVFGGTGASRTVQITPAANQSGVATITLTVSDGVASAGTSFQFTVNAVNDAPTISAIGNQATSSGTAVGPISFTVADVDTPLANLTLSGASSNPALVPNANIVFGGTAGNRTVTVTPAAGQTGSSTITVTVSDGTQTANSSFLLSVGTGGGGGGTATIGFTQVNAATPQTPQSIVAVPYVGAQHAGNLNVAIVSWNDTTVSVSSVSDSNGNAYSLAVGPTSFPGRSSQSIYYAPNIVGAAPNSNIVTVRFNGAAVFPDIRVLEYSGIDPVSPLDAVTGSSGTSATTSSGILTTTVPNVLLVAGNVVETVTQTPGANFSKRIITTPDGDIAEDRVVSAIGSYEATAVIDPSGSWIMQMVAFRAASVQSDPTPPTVTVTSPVANATVTAIVTLAATATDNISVEGVQFFLDGVPLGPEILDPPYSMPWDTTTSTLGLHTLTATARDGVGNVTTSTPVPVTVRTQTLADTGQWVPPAAWPLVAIHVALLPTGDVLAWDGANQQGAAFVWRPSTNTFTSKNPPDNIFCAGHCMLSDGRVLVVGGHIANFVGLPDANIFNPATSGWTQVMSMAFGRWYPTAVPLPDRRVLVVGGKDGCETCIASIPEIYDADLNTWTQLPGASNPLPEYPHLFVLPDGRVLATGSFELPIATQVLDINTQTWTVVDPVVVDGHSSVMYSLNKFMKSGTSNPATEAAPKPAAATTYVLDMNQPQPAWRSTAPMAFPRAYHNLTLLPDGTVLATGGEKNTDVFDQTQAVFPAELWSPVTESWTTLAPLSVPRFYHSTALLLPDARVLVAGGGRWGGGAVDDQLSAEIYSPPYLFKGTRPAITSAPSALAYNSPFSVVTPDAARIASVSMLPLGTVTHHFNQNQRYLNLPFQVIAGGLSIQAPANANIAPPGYYMLFLVDTNGVPSLAAIMKAQ